MTRDDQFIGLLERDLDEYEGLTPLPDAVRNSVRAALPKTKQGPTLGLARFYGMSNAFKLGIAAAVIGVAALIGFSLYSNNIGDPDETPTASPTASATGPMSLMDSPSQGEPTLRVGDYYLDHPAFPARIDFTVPEGWWYWSDSSAPADSTAHGVLVDSADTGAANGSAWGVAFAVVDEVRVDPCNGGAMDTSVSESAASMAEAMAGWADFPASVEDVMLSGFSGKRVEISRSEGIDCPPTFFTTPSGYGFGPEFSSFDPPVNQFTLLDVDGSVLVIWTTDYPGTSEFEEAGGASPDPRAHVEDQAQLQQILDSIVITSR
jgi:hypothetical protein